MKIIISAVFVLFIVASCGSEPENQNYDKINDVQITILNISGRDIKEICINNEQKIKCSAGLADKSETIINLTCQSETSYTMQVIFVNDDSLKTLGNYVEGGYRVKETIFNDSIETTTNIY